MGLYAFSPLYAKLINCMVFFKEKKKPQQMKFICMPSST